MTDENVVDLLDALENRRRNLAGLTPTEMRAIEAALTERVYQATRKAALQLRGELPVPRPGSNALKLLSRIEERREISRS
jgi:hypothetical protein